MTHKAKSIVVVGGGINGLVAANYLRRGGFQVTLLERKPRVGGACTSATLRHRGAAIDYPPGASVLGMMQQFVFEETGLAREVELWRSSHPKIIYFHDDPKPYLYPFPLAALTKHAKERWGERGRFEQFERDQAKVVAFLRRGYRAGNPPTVRDAEKALGKRQTALWITGTARQLLDHYLTTERMKIYSAMTVTESGAVGLDAPYSAFTIPLMSSGGVFDGKWGFVKGGIWQMTRALGRINRRHGVKIVTSARVTAVSRAQKSVRYTRHGRAREMAADKIVFATDPLSAAKLVRDRGLVARVSAQQLLGSSGKLVMIFKRPVRFKDDNGQPGFHAAFRFIFMNTTLAGFERSTQAPGKGVDFSPGYLQIYCEGPAMEAFGQRRRFHVISVFFKDLGCHTRGRELPKVKEEVTRLVCGKIENTQDLVRTILSTPKDLQEEFYFPMGNIDHTALTGGQTYFDRNYSPDPARSFYQFGESDDVFYCGAGSYPCGSVAGTPGYMCAKQILRGAGRGR